MRDATKNEPGPITIAIREYRESKSQAAFTYLYQQLSSLVASIAQKRLGKSARLMDVDDVVQSVMRRVAEGLDAKKTWFVETATDERALRCMLCHMTALRCLSVFQYESVEARRIIQRDADCDEFSDARSTLFVDSRTDHEVEVQFDQIVEIIRDALLASHATQGKENARVFDGLLKYETIQEIASALNTSPRTIVRRLVNVREIVAQQLRLIDEDLDID